MEVTRCGGILLVSMVEKCLTNTPSKPGALIIESSDFNKSVALSQISLSISFEQQLNSISFTSSDNFMEPCFSLVLIDVVSVQTFDSLKALLVVADPTTGADENAFNADLSVSNSYDFLSVRMVHLHK